MRTLFLSLALLAATVASAQVPSVVVENAKGEAFDTKALLDEQTPMIVSFWSTSCKPCIRELDAVYDALPDWKDEAEFRVVAVSTDDSRLMAKAKSFAQGRGWGDDYILLFDKNQDFMRAMNVSVVPHVFVIDAKGKVVYSHTSYVPGNELELIDIYNNDDIKFTHDKVSGIVTMTVGDQVYTIHTNDPEVVGGRTYGNVVATNGTALPVFLATVE